MTPPKKRRKVASSLQILSAKGEEFMARFDDDSQQKYRTAIRPNSSHAANKISPDLSLLSSCPPNPIREELDKASLRPPDLHKAAAQTAAIKAAVKTNYQQKGPSSAKAKRLFLAGKAELAHAHVNERSLAKRTGTLKDEQVNFVEVLREVESLGALGMDKKQQARIRAESLARISARPDRKPKVPANQAKEMLKKQAKQEKQERQSAIDSGMIQQKGMGKQRRRRNELERKSNLGLVEDGGAFRKGVLELGRLPGGPTRKKKQKQRKLK